MSKSMLAIFFLIVFYSTPNYGQLQTSNNSPELNMEIFSYPYFLDNEQHKELILTMGVFENMNIELQGFYDTYLLENRSRGSIILKRYIDKNIYILIGAEAEWRQGKSLVPIRRPPRLGASVGFGYEIENSFSLESKSNFATNKEAMGAFGEPFIPMPQLHTIRGKIKF